MKLALALLLVAACGGDDATMADVDAMPVGPDGSLDPCVAQLQQPVVDAWGIAWDTIERAPNSLANAEHDCNAFGGRLPLATELWRVRGSQPDAIPGALGDRPLWSSVTDGPDGQVTIALVDGVPATTTMLPSGKAYRCVCPPPVVAPFTGAHCHGPPRQPCFPMGTQNLDESDRPALSTSSAIAECAAAGGHVATFADLAHAIPHGLLGSGEVVRVADQVSPLTTAALRWTVATTNDVRSTAAMTDRMPFRCAGPAIIGKTPGLDASWLVMASGVAIDRADRAPLSWAAAHDACVADSGHVASTFELAAAIDEGLEGSGVFLWADEPVPDPATATDETGTVSWTGALRGFRYAMATATTGVGETHKTGTRAFRCVRYPLDSAWTPPSGLTAIPAGNHVVYLDETDSSATDFATAAATCAARGGRVPQERDYFEIVRELGHGVSTTRLWTSDLGSAHVIVLANDAFDDVNPGAELANPGTAWPFRCLYSPELR